MSCQWDRHAFIGVGCPLLTGVWERSMPQACVEGASGASLEFQSYGLSWVDPRSGMGEEMSRWTLLGVWGAYRGGVETEALANCDVCLRAKNLCGEQAEPTGRDRPGLAGQRRKKKDARVPSKRHHRRPLPGENTPFHHHRATSGSICAPYL